MHDRRDLIAAPDGSAQRRSGVADGEGVALDPAHGRGGSRRGSEGVRGVNAELARRAHAIFKAALELSAEDREAMVAQACGSDEALASCVRRLLAATQRDT